MTATTAAPKTITTAKWRRRRRRQRQRGTQRGSKYESPGIFTLEGVAVTRCRKPVVLWILKKAHCPKLRLRRKRRKRYSRRRRRRRRR